jgi:hypothetical protein
VKARGVWTLAGVLLVIAVVSFVAGYYAMIRFLT